METEAYFCNFVGDSSIIFLISHTFKDKCYYKTKVYYVHFMHFYVDCCTFILVYCTSMKKRV